MALYMLAATHLYSLSCVQKMCIWLKEFRYVYKFFALCRWFVVNSFCGRWRKKCPERLNVVPYTISLGQHCISIFASVHSSRRINGGCSRHFLLSANVFRADSNLRWKSSSKSLTSGWYANILILLLPKSFISCLNSSDLNFRPLSVLMTAGTPKRSTYPDIRFCCKVWHRKSYKPAREQAHVNK